jgi:hypothetical protein
LSSLFELVHMDSAKTFYCKKNEKQNSFHSLNRSIFKWLLIVIQKINEMIRFEKRG